MSHKEPSSMDNTALLRDGAPAPGGSEGYGTTPESQAPYIQHPQPRSRASSTTSVPPKSPSQAPNRASLTVTNDAAGSGRNESFNSNAGSSRHGTPAKGASAKHEIFFEEVDAAPPPPLVPVMAAATASAREPERVWHGDPRLRHCVAVVNRLSGERSAAEHVYQGLISLVGGHRVLDLTGAVFRDPTPLIDLIAEHAVPRSDEQHSGATHTAAQVEYLRGTVVVSGGDGTVSFVMSVIDKLVERAQLKSGGEREGPTSRNHVGGRSLLVPAVAVLALGTGNDLSNCIGFGLGYTKNALCCCCVCCPNDIIAHANAAIAAPSVAFDRWDVVIETLHPDGSVAQTRQFTANNYFSIGMDSWIANQFDQKRKAHPGCFQYRFLNKMHYGQLGLQGWWNCKRLDDYVTITIEGVASHMPPKSKALIVSNVNSYSGGGKLWVVPKRAAKRTGEAERTGSDGTTAFNAVDATPVYINDGKVEIQTLGGLVDMSLLQMHVGGGAKKIHQGSSCVINVHGSDCAAARKPGAPVVPIFAQVDGEPVGAITQSTRITVTKHLVQGFVRCRSTDVILPQSASLLR